MTGATDTRVVYGARCVWWNNIAAVSTTPRGLPCCPHCGGVLFEVPDEQTWWAGVDAHESTHEPGYRKFVEWLRGRCYPSIDEARAAYAEHQRQVEEIKEDDGGQRTD